MLGNLERIMVLYFVYIYYALRNINRVLFRHILSIFEFFRLSRSEQYSCNHVAIIAYALLKHDKWRFDVRMGFIVFYYEVIN